MKIELTDPRLTAYALDELTGDARTEFETLLNDDPEARAEVDSIRATAGVLTAALSTEAAATATAAPAASAKPVPAPMRITPAANHDRRRRTTGILIAAAASVVLVGGGLWIALRDEPVKSLGMLAASGAGGAGHTSLYSEQSAGDGAQQGPRGIGAPTASPQPPAPSLATSSGQQDKENAVNDGARKQSADQWARLLQNGGPAVKAEPQASRRSEVAAAAEMPRPTGKPSATIYDASPREVGASPNSVLSDGNARVDAAKSPAPTLASAAPGAGAGGHGTGGANTFQRAGTESRLTIVPLGAAAPQPVVVNGRDSRDFDAAGARVEREFNTESYDRITDNSFLDARTNPLSTFSIDVDTASYSNVRRFLTQGQLPPKDAVRIEELVNYFPYGYEPPKVDFTRGRGSQEDLVRRVRDQTDPFAAHVAVTTCPWNDKHRLVRVALKGKEIPKDQRPPSNLVFLLDVSGSMNEPNKLPLVKESMKGLVEQLGENDRVAIAVYAGNSGLVLPPTRCNKRETILGAIDNLQPGGSTNGAAGIGLAYQQAVSGFIKDGTNRVILCTDGDFNVGVTDQGALTRLIEEKAKSGVFLSVLGFGMGNTKDSTMEKLADKGNGNYAYIDTLSEGRKVLVEQMTGTLLTIAKDVKIQIEFNPAKVGSYRLIGYENRMLAKEDFNNDKKDAGEIGAGHTVTAFYEIAPVGEQKSEARAVEQIDAEIRKINEGLKIKEMTPEDLKVVQDQLAKLDEERIRVAAGTTTPPVDPLKYQAAPAPTPVASTDELLTLKLRYKPPTGDTSKLLEFPIADATTPIDKADEDMRFATSVASFGMLLRDSEYKGSSTFAGVREMAGAALGKDESGYRKEFLELVKRAEAMSPAATPR